MITTQSGGGELSRLTLGSCAVVPGVEENLLEQSIYFFWGRKQFFILPAVKNKLFIFVCIKDETIFFSTYFCEPTGHAVSFDDNMSTSVGSLVM